MKQAVADRRKLLLGGMALLVGATAPRLADAADYAVFTEFSPDAKLMRPGWNRRIFTDTDARKGTAIQCDFATGIVTLAPRAHRRPLHRRLRQRYRAAGDDHDPSPGFGGLLPAPYL